MAFVLKQSASYKWPVTCRLPVDGGRFEKQTFEAVFKRLPQARINEIRTEAQRMVKAAERSEAIEDGITDQSIAHEVLIGWSGILDDDGDEVPFSATACEQLLNVPMVASAVIEAYFDSLTGNKTKN